MVALVLPDAKPGTIRLAYVRSLTVGGLLIRAAQWWTPWCHVGVVAPDGEVINARAFRGVVGEPWPVFAARYSACELVDVPAPQPEAGIAWARALKGARYDYGALGNMVSSRLGMRPSDERFDCVEVAEAALAAAGRPRFRVVASRLTVWQSYIAA